LAPLVPQLLAILHADRSERRLPSRRVLHALATFGHNLQPRLHLVWVRVRVRVS
jgi:FKBP12-rapamycin complex-associated protein